MRTTEKSATPIHPLLSTAALLAVYTALVVLGVIGKYIGRMYEQVKGRPLFIIERVVRSSDGSPGRGGNVTAESGRYPDRELGCEVCSTPGI
jgi:hypothetical protein